MTRTIARFGTAAKLLTCLAAAAFASAPVLGQTHRAIEIPFPFSVPAGKTPLPAGSYTISQSWDILLLESSTGEKTRQMIITRLSGPNSFLQSGSLVFDSTDGRKVLSEVWFPGEDGILVYSLPKGHTRTVLSFSDLSVNGHASGKSAFELTCARCHGERGEGNADADRYFGLTIPRLNAPEVQSKSDTELRQIVTTGTQNMPPVEVEDSGFRHRLPPQDVDAVIAYLRTLKP